MIPRHRPLGDVEAELGELIVDTGPAPGRMLARPLDDERPNLPLKSRPTRAALDRAPVALEGVRMPADDRLRLDDHESILPAAPSTTQSHPEQTLLQSTKASRSRQHSDLLAKGEVLEQEVRA